VVSRPAGPQYSEVAIVGGVFRVEGAAGARTVGRRGAGRGRRRRSWWLAVALIGALAAAGLACDVADPGPDDTLTDAKLATPADYTVETPVVAGGPAVDVYRPHSPATGTPVLVYIHSGGWYSGNRGEITDPTRSAGRAVLAQVRRGFTVVSVDYALAFDAPFPAGLLDVKRGIRWIRSRPEWAQSRLVVAGNSAGGNLAAMVAVTAGVPGLEPVEGEPTVVDAAVVLDGPLNLRAMQTEPWVRQPWCCGVASAVEGQHFGAFMETGEMVPAYLGCADPSVTDGHLTPACAATVDAEIDRASPSSHVDAGDPPLYIACNAVNIVLPDCAADHRPFADAYIAAHGGADDIVHFDQLDQPEANHFTVDTNLNLTALQDFLDTV
jgi:hypothetical protein